MNKKKKKSIENESQLMILIKAMFKEEYRFHLSMSGRSYFFLLMYIITTTTFFLAIIIPYLEESGGIGQVEIEKGDISIDREITVLHYAIIFYGLGVGAFAFTGKGVIERQFGQINLLVSSPDTLPIKPKDSYIALFIRDTLFYMPVLIVPITVGLLFSIPFNPFGLYSVLFFSMALCLSFLTGISLSFFVSALYAHSLKVFFACIIGVSLIVILVLSLNPIYLDYLIPTVNLQFNKTIVNFLYSIVFILLLSTLALAFAKEIPEVTKYAHSIFLEEEKKWRFFKEKSSLLAKEFIDLNRSMVIIKILMSLTIPLFFIAMLIYYLKNVMNSEELTFNTLFWAEMIGLFGILNYNWITTVDNLESFRVLPLSVPQIIKIKILVYIILTIGFSIFYIIVISWFLDELWMLIFSIPVMIITIVYVVVSTAYLTGLKMNAFLFNPAILIKLGLLLLIPFLCVEILNLAMEYDQTSALVAIMGVCVFMSLSAYMLYLAIDTKWSREEFGGV